MTLYKVDNVYIYSISRSTSRKNFSSALFKKYLFKFWVVKNLLHERYYLLYKHIVTYNVYPNVLF